MRLLSRHQLLLGRNQILWRYGLALQRIVRAVGREDSRREARLRPVDSGGMRLSAMLRTYENFGYVINFYVTSEIWVYLMNSPPRLYILSVSRIDSYTRNSCKPLYFRLASCNEAGF